MIHYTLSIANASAHHFEVRCQITHPNPEGQRLSLPAWIPGSYKIRDFSKNILWLSAESEGHPIPVVKLDKQQWRCNPCSGALTIRYRIYAWDLSVRSAHLDENHAFFNGTSLFLNVDGFSNHPHQLTLSPPETTLPWGVATTLPPVETDEDGWGRYQCKDYESLIDHPVEMGRFEWINFMVCGVPHAIVLTGHHQADTERLAEDLSQICEHHTRFFGDMEPPVDQYLFLTLVVGSGYGGLEHRDSCALICSREDLPRVGDESVSEGYRKFLGLCSHEYFHLWNIKKIRPEVFSPYRLDRESYTRQLWAFEGITSYYDDLSLVQCGLITTESYLELLGETLTRLQRNRGQWIQSVTDSSLDAWSKFYQQDENANNAIVSYYTKGAIIALMIDLYLRQQSSGQVTLQQVMQPLWERYGKQGRGVPETLIEQLCHQIAGSEIPFLWDALYSTKPLEPAPLLQRMGVESRLRPTTSKKDRGGQWSKKEPLSWLGALLTDTHHALRVDRVTDGGPAQQAGISSGDQIIALDHLQVSESSLQSILYQREPGSKITIHLFRRDELMERVATLVAPPNDTVVLELMAAPTPQQTTLQQQWLHQSDRL